MLLKCKVCDKETENVFNVRLKPVAICEECANAIAMQQVTFLIIAYNKPLEPTTKAGDLQNIV